MIPMLERMLATIGLFNDTREVISFQTLPCFDPLDLGLSLQYRTTPHCYCMVVPETMEMTIAPVYLVDH